MAQKPLAEPALEPEPGWTAMAMALPPPGARYVSGDPDSDGLRVRYYLRPEGSGSPGLGGKIWFGPGTEGPPGHAHGGSMAAALDEAMGFSCWVAGHAVVAAKITVEFLRLLPLGTTVTLEAWVDRAAGRKVHSKGHLIGPDGKPYARAEGLFVVLGSQKFGELLNRNA